MLYCLVIHQVSLTNQIYDRAGEQRGDKLDWSMTREDLLDNITPLFIFYFYSYYDPTWNYLVGKKSLYDPHFQRMAHILIIS